MKKNIRFAMLLGLCGLFFTACEQEEEQQIISGNRFRVEAPKFVDNDKTYLQFTNDLSRIIYEEGDKVYINGVEFTLSKDGDVWWANSSQTVTAPELYVAYADGAVADWSESAHTYSFNLNSTIDDPDHNKVVLCGTARENGYAITLAPACAILRLNTRGAGRNYNYVKVGFDANKIPKLGTINVTNRNLSAGVNSNYLTGVTSGGDGQFLNMRYSDPASTGEDDYWYVAIPIEGSSVTTTLYLEWNDGSTTVQHRTQAPVELRKGYVYTLGTSRVSPFTANGVSNCSFLVSASKEVLFSAGNLQAQRYRSGSTYVYKWRFADHQYDVIGSSNSTNITVNGSWFDLFGYATSGFNNGQTAYAPNSTSSTNGDYFNGNINGTNSDWGRYIKSSPGIYYGSTLVTSENWRTLTKDEWSYLMGRSGKVAFATIAGNYKGVVLLPDYDEIGAPWNYAEKLPSGPSFTAGFAGGYTTNSYTASEWDVLEMAGAIFIPATGYRTGTTVNNTDDGYYWSSSIGTAALGKNRAYLQFFNGSTCSTGQYQLQQGQAVRLVIEIQ